MVVVVFQNGTGLAHVLSWTADRDYTILGASGNAALMSFDPQLIYTTGFSSPSADLVTERFQFEAGSWSQNLLVPLLKGETIYCASSANKGTTHLYLEPGS